MLIKNTDGSYCKIKDIKVSGLEAYITLIIYSSIPQTSSDIYGNVNRVFSFYLRDKDSTELYKLDNNNYWIDRLHNYNNESRNIDINMYKEIILKVDITNNNTSEMIDNKWVRYCNIVMIDHTTTTEEAWVSEDLTLISKGIELPEITNFHVTRNSNDTLSVSFKYNYESQKDFNYANTNLVSTIEIRSLYSNEIFEQYTLDTDAVVYDTLNSYTAPVTIYIFIKNLREDVLYQTSQVFNPNVNFATMAIKQDTTTHITSAAIKDTDVKSIKQITIK